VISAISIAANKEIKLLDTERRIEWGAGMTALQ
jgi:hypothetical protein